MVQAVWRELDLPLPGPFSAHVQKAVLAIHIQETQRAQFGDQQTSLQENPEDGTIARCSLIRQWAERLRGVTGQQEPVKHLSFEEPDATMFCSGHDPMSERRAPQIPLPH